MVTPRKSGSGEVLESGEVNEFFSQKIQLYAESFEKKLNALSLEIKMCKKRH